MSWFSPINDPHYTLDAFKHKTNSVNFAKWENKEYQNLLDLAARELDPSSRMHYLAAAEKFLIEQAILLPIFYEANLCKKKPYLKEIYQRTGQIDFKWAYIERNFSYKYFQDSNLARFCRKNIIQRRPYEP
jgi:oligopeptide transport system substrate-binding protein